MRELASALAPWEELCKYSSLADLKTSIFDSKDELGAIIGLRSLCWKIFLLFRNLDPTSWPAALTNSRSAYASLRSHYLRAIEHPDEIASSTDPLSADTESPWTALRSDEALRSEIFQDVERCMPENVYFRQPDTQNCLLDILFVYCKLNPDVGYRQGMHELLAPILWAIERDAIDIGEGQSGKSSNQVLATALDSKFIEHDTFTLFGLVMQTAKTFYDPATETRLGKPVPKPRGRPVESESAILIRCRRIFSTLLPQVDPALATHLEELEISPQIFLMRWIRLIFGREFPFDDLLRVWTLLFAEDPSIELIDYICVAMLLRIRWQLMGADVNEALMLLMRYPSPSAPHEPHTFVHDAIYLKANANVDGGISLVTKYSGHAPPRTTLERPLTPDQPSRSETPDSRRARSPFDSPAAAANTVENALHDAARGFLNRGERWGLNQALRDAVGEVRKNVQGLNSGRASPRTGSMSGIRPLHRTTRSDVSSNIAANVLRKITALEERNKQMAKMLEGAVSELWKFEKEASEKKDLEADSLQSLSMAVAKVQFVQVFLQDATLPLPPEEAENISSDPPKDEPNLEPTTEKAAPPAIEPASEPIESQPPPAATPLNDFVATPTRSSSIPIPQVIRPSSTQPPPQGLPTTLLSPEHASAPTPAGLSAASSTNLSSSLSSRPRLEQSSFSWMLGQAHEDRAGFVTASPFSPHEKRWNAAHGGTEKGFLFGEEDEVVGEVKVKEEKGKGKNKGGKAKSGSLLAREDIGLGDMGSSPDV